MFKKIILLILLSLIIITGCSQLKLIDCGNGICDVEENYKLCPKDCELLSSSCGERIAQSLYISSAYVEGKPVQINGTHGDLWFSTWADDNNIYMSWGDGSGFGDEMTDVGISRITGIPPNLIGELLYIDRTKEEMGKFLFPEETYEVEKYDDKPSSLLFIDGILYGHFHTPLGDSRLGYLAFSKDYGISWERVGFYDYNDVPTEDSSPWSAKYTGEKRQSRVGSNFRCMFFINYGMNYELNEDGYVYALGIGREWGWNEGIYLARVKRESVLEYDSYEYFVTLKNGQPFWSQLEKKAQPLEGLNTFGQFSSIYHPDLDRYLIMNAENVYDAPNPWGPWTCAGNWVQEGWHGYQPGIISKFSENNTFWFTISGQPPLGNEVEYALNLGKIIMETN